MVTAGVTFVVVSHVLCPVVGGTVVEVAVVGGTVVEVAVVGFRVGVCVAISGFK